MVYSNPSSITFSHINKILTKSYRIRLQQGLIWFCYALWICYDIYHFIKVTYDRILIKVSSKFQDKFEVSVHLLKIKIISINNNSKIMINCLLNAYLIFWFLWVCINVRWSYVLKYGYKYDVLIISLISVLHWDKCLYIEILNRKTFITC